MTQAPGPRGNLFWGVWPAFQRDPVGVLQAAGADHGDIVRLRFGPITAHLLNNPDHIAHVLSRHADRYDKNTRSVARIKDTCGTSLLSAHEAAGAQHRRLLQPLFQPGAVARHKTQVIDITQQRLASWRGADAPVDVVHEMTTLVCRIAAKILFGAEVNAAKIETALAVILQDTWRRIKAPFDLARLSPAFHKRAFRDAVAQVDQIVFAIIAQRRMQGAVFDDVLGRLMQAQDGDALSDRALRDAVVTLLLAGHETTANALAWALWHCGQHPCAARAETRHIFAETIRLYPSIWIIERRAKVADQIGGYSIPKGSFVMISPYLLHRNPAVFPDPEAFDPARFASDAGADRHRHAYLPFGLGAHRCVGLHLAQMIGTTVLDTLRAQVTLQSLDPDTARIDPSMTLRHAGPLLMRPAWR